jgi:hypothetical protein
MEAGRCSVLARTRTRARGGAGASARAGHRAGNERGASLVEITAVLFILGLVLATVYSTIWSGQHTVSDASERLRNLDEARSLMATITKDVRTAVRTEAGTSPFLKADKEEVVFYANLETTSAPKLVRVYVDAQDRLYEEVWTHDPTSVAPEYQFGGTSYRAIPSTCGTRCTVRLVGHFVANTPTEPLFSFLADDGSLLTTPMEGSDTGLLSIKSVEIELRVKRNTNRNVNTTVIQNTVRLPNLEYSAVAG